MDEKIRRNGHTPTKNTRKKWTVMVYLAGDNNLTSNCITVLQQLEAAKYKDDVRVLACFDSNTPWPKGSRYLAINGKLRPNDKDLNWEIYNDLIVPRDRNHDITAPDFCGGDDKPRGSSMKRTGVAEGLKRFLEWAMDQGKSDHYMLVLYGHGPVVAGNTFLARENPVSSLRMKDLPKVLERHFGDGKPKLDILAFQNCVMNGIETAYEVQHRVKYMIGSQGLVLAYGWPYERIIKALVDNPTDSPLKITEKILKACARHMIDFSVMDRSSEQSVCDLSKLKNRRSITAAIKALSVELQATLKFIPVPCERLLEDENQKVLQYPVICDAVRLARLEAQSFWDETFVDIYDFCERLLRKCNEAVLVQTELIGTLGLDGTLEPRVRDLMDRLERIIRCCMNVMDRVEEMVPHSYYIGPELQYSRGLSIYFPWSMPAGPYSFYYRKQQNEHVLVTAFETYSRYKFVKDSGWAEFLKSFYRATLRNVRRAHRKYEMRINEPLSAGMVREIYTAPQEVLTTEFLRKTDSDSGSTAFEVWSYVKNYPRRNYLSPSDCPRKVETAGCHRPGESPKYQNPLSPPVSYLGWNICEFVANVIRRRQPRNGNNRNGSIKKKTSSRQKTVSVRSRTGAATAADYSTRS